MSLYNKVNIFLYILVDKELFIFNECFIRVNLFIIFSEYKA